MEEQLTQLIATLNHAMQQGLDNLPAVATLLVEEYAGYHFVKAVIWSVLAAIPAGITIFGWIMALVEGLKSDDLPPFLFFTLIIGGAATGLALIAISNWGAAIYPLGSILAGKL